MTKVAWLQSPTALLTERSIINFLIWTIGLIAGPYIAVTALYGNYLPVEVAMGITAVAVVFAFGGDRMCILPFIALFCAGQLNFLPLDLTPVELACLATLSYYLISYLALRRKLMRAGPWIFVVPIFVFIGILMHNEPNFGLRVLGSGSQGGRKTFSILIAGLTYLCGVSMNSPSPKFLGRVPIYCVVGTGIFAIPYIVTTYFPATAPYLYLVTQSINVMAYENTMLGSDELVRSRGQADLAIAILTCLICYFPITSWWRPNRWWMLGFAILSLAFAMLGGFRSTLVEFVATVLIATACYIRARALLLLLPCVFIVAMLVVAQDNHWITLPGSAQRSLSFLPGDWDPEVTGDSASSNEFRSGIINVYLNEYAAAHPWFGNGLSYDEETYELVNYMATYHETGDHYWRSKLFITNKLFHTGWISLYDAVGLVGSFFFILLGLSLIYLQARTIFGKSVNRSSVLFPLKVWVFSYATTWFISFFTLFGDVAGEFTILSFMAVVYFHINQVESKGFEKVPTPREMPFDPVRSGLPVSA